MEFQLFWYFKVGNQKRPITVLKILLHFIYTHNCLKGLLSMDAFERRKIFASFSCAVLYFISVSYSTHANNRTIVLLSVVITLNNMFDSNLVFFFILV